MTEITRGYKQVLLTTCLECCFTGISRIGRCTHCFKEGSVAVEKGIACLTDIQRIHTIRECQTGSYKFRCAKAFVELLVTLGGQSTQHKMGRSIYDPYFIYLLGSYVVTDLDTVNDYGAGIHFFLTFDEAVNFNYG